MSKVSFEQLEKAGLGGVGSYSLSAFQELDQPVQNFVGVAELAFPDDGDAPAEAA